MEINIQNEKIELIQWLTTLNDKNVIEKLVRIRNTERKDWWNDISNEEKNSIEKGLIEANAGSLKPHNEARKIYEKWL